MAILIKGVVIPMRGGKLLTPFLQVTTGNGGEERPPKCSAGVARASCSRASESRTGPVRGQDAPATLERSSPYYLGQSHLEFRLLGRKADAEILTTDHTDYTDRGRFGFLCIRAIGVIRG
jgi:hypothetical protein